MNNTDKNMITQMIRAGRFNPEICDLLRQKQVEDSKKMIKQMGERYCCHANNAPKKGAY
jgi:hypothetical protein